ncbi:MAG TPA: nuclear transport factor 2 family protein [Kofleriaceae bacterium]|nr:nuclear transport factor 2 family protein [Kofleriaceae bacterium]
MTTREVAERLYACFQAQDGEGMAALYAPSARFSDPVFPSLDGAGVGDMWRMLASRAKDFSLVVDGIEHEGEVARVRWTAHYLFSATGRAVVNRVSSTIRVRDGLIVEQRDAFDFRKWARQAFGLAGMFLGGRGFFQRRVQAKAAENLAAFRSSRS